MNLINSIVGIFILAVLVVIGYDVGKIAIELNSPTIPTTDTTQFTKPLENHHSVDLRWNHFPVTVYIDDSYVRHTNPEHVTSVLTALDMWGQAGIVSFSILQSPGADITIEWVPTLKEKSTDTLGNTDLKFFNISRFGVVQSADIQMLTKSNSRQLNSYDMTNLALHEIGHALGLQHTDEGIMDPVLVVPSNDVKKISSSDISSLQKLYDTPAKPDLEIGSVNATKFTFTRFGKDYYYLNITTSIRNIGLTDSSSPVLSIYAGNEIISEDMLSDLELGNTLSIFQGNLRAENNFTSVKVWIDPQNLIDELNETNNLVEIPV